MLSKDKTRKIIVKIYWPIPLRDKGLRAFGIYFATRVRVELIRRCLSQTRVIHV
jgi:hypothetical protein